MKAKERLTTNYKCQVCGQIIHTGKYHPEECCESFKAGIREVVDTMECLFHFYDCYTSDCPIYPKWQAKLKEWGIK